MGTSSRSNFSNIFLSVLILKRAKASPFSGLEPIDILTVLRGAFPFVASDLFFEVGTFCGDIYRYIFQGDTVVRGNLLRVMEWN
jgi:hypothetical protein